MNKQTPPEWLDVNEAAALAGRSVSTIRRVISTIEKENPESIRREPLKDKGGEKILIARAYLVERFEVQETPQEAGADLPVKSPQGGQPVGDIVEILERQIDAKDKQIAALQREAESKSRQIEQEQQTVAEMSESLRQFAALNTSLNNKLLALTERAGEHPARASAGGEPTREAGFNWYSIAVAVGLSLIVGLILYLVLTWSGG